MSEQEKLELERYRAFHQGLRRRREEIPGELEALRQTGKGKTVQFTAKVTHVADEYAVVEPFNADVWDWDCDVQICFEDMDDLKKVTEGKMVTIVGECYGQADMYTAKICRAIVKK